MKRLPEWINKVIRYTVAGYTDRLNAIRFDSVNESVKAEYRRINNAILDALSEMLDDKAIRDIFRRDIANRTGWQFSEAKSCFSCDSYKRNKNKIIYLMAKNLHLIN